MEFDEKLAQALGETFDERMARRMKVTKKHSFSLSYRLWEYKTLKNLRRNRFDNHWTLRKARCAVAAMVCALTLLIGITAYAAIVIMGRYNFVDKSDYSKMLIEAHPTDKTTFEEYYGLPEEDGWEMEDYDILHRFTAVNYRRGDKEVTFCQSLIEEGNMGNINTEKADVEMLSLYSENDGFVLEFRDDWSSIFWIYNGYLLEITGNINKKEAVNLAHSTKIIDLQKSR